MGGGRDEEGLDSSTTGGVEGWRVEGGEAVMPEWRQASGRMGRGGRNGRNGRRRRIRMGGYGRSQRRSGEGKERTLVMPRLRGQERPHCSVGRPGIEENNK